MAAEAANELVVLLQGRAVGTISQREGRLELVYGDEWRRDALATPLSLSLPLARRMHTDPEVRSFLWGLLPDNDQVLERWARTYQVSPRNPFALLRHVGEDCAGAAQFVPADRVDALLQGAGGVEWLDEAEIGERLRVLRHDPTAWHAARTGQFSLAGAQAKTALLHDPETDRWGDPWGNQPTTHILKPAVTGFDDHDLNEHLCLSAARHLGLSVTTSAVLSFAGERAIVIGRYDRVRADGALIRVHQEDLCQALGVPPTQKYENEGGPSVEEIARLLRAEIRPVPTAATTVGRFLDALAFNWIIGGSDAHAKNYSVLLAGRQVRLAPLYDIASALPYPDIHRPKLRLAMRIGGEYRMTQVGARHWTRLAVAVGLDPDALLSRVDDLAAQAPDAFGRARAEDAVQALDSGLPARLLDVVAANAQACRDALQVVTR